MKKILVPVDYSPVSDSAASYAANLAQVMNCQLVLFHAMQVPVPPAEIPPVYFTGADLEIENKKKLSEFLSKLKNKFPETEISYELRYDFVKDGISEVSNSSDYRMIVMGITPAGGIMQTFPGGTAVNLINDINIPLLIVPETASFKGLKKVVVALSYEKNDLKKTLKPLRELAILNGSELIFTHVLKHDEETDSVQKTETEDLLNTTFKGMNLSFTYPFHEDLYQGLNDQVTENGADLLVMLHHKRGFLSSLFSREHTRKLAYLTKVPLLVLPVD